MVVLNLHGKFEMIKDMISRHKLITPMHLDTVYMLACHGKDIASSSPGAAVTMPYGRHGAKVPAP